MCKDCGCDSLQSAVRITKIDKNTKFVEKHIELEANILQENDKIAEHNRQHFSTNNNIVINFLSSPGSGKTTLLVDTINKLKQDFDFYVIEGDQQTLNDAQRINETGVPVIQINTGDGCHLDSEMIHNACHKLAMKKGGILFIENVGNLVCPAMFDLGETKRVVVISTTEGEDKPLKYPKIFASADVCIINKTDLLPYLNFDINLLKTNAQKINPQVEIIEHNFNLADSDWYQWIKSI